LGFEDDEEEDGGFEVDEEEGCEIGFAASETGFPPRSRLLREFGFCVGCFEFVAVEEDEDGSGAISDPTAEFEGLGAAAFPMVTTSPELNLISFCPSDVCPLFEGSFFGSWPFL
jgi:hypothetical protein